MFVQARNIYLIDFGRYVCARIWMTNGIGRAAVLLLAGCIFAHSACGATPDPSWTSYIGVHYRTERWAKSIRGPEGSRILDEKTAVLLDKYSGGRDLLLADRTGLGGGRDYENALRYLRTIELDGGKSWRTSVRERTRALMEGPRKDRRIYWQVGNEINSSYVGTVVQRLLGAEETDRHHDKRIIPIYVEYYLAPFVEAINEFKAGKSPQPDIRIMLGSVGNGPNPIAQQWLEELLNYRVNGRFAQSLSGKRVFEIVDYISLHYLLTNGDGNWQQSFDRLNTSWVGKGTIRGIWATEELGRRWVEAGWGAANAFKVFGRFFSETTAKGLSSDDYRMSFWGHQFGKNGTSGADAGKAFWEVFGDNTAVQSWPIKAVGYPRGIEGYVFTAQPSSGGAMLVLFPRTRKGNVSLRILEATGAWRASGQGKLVISSNRGMEPVAGVVRFEPGRLKLMLDNVLTLADQAVLVARIEAQR